MNTNIKRSLPLMALILALIVVARVAFPGAFRSGVRIGFVGNDSLHSFTGKYVKLTGTSTHTISPSKDSSVIHCEFTSESGTLHVEITEKDSETVICDRDITEDTELDVQATGKVKIKLSTEGHKGSYSFKY